ncbi:MAG TPA: hypothetical protein VFE19_05815 [Jatrophihabitantaceae bacterium]|nr:hypothetical protein [Jatrophihabitantaceae bacterium]
MSVAFTGPVRRWQAAGLEQFDSVASRRELREVGVSKAVIAAHVRARRWQVYGLAIILHNGRPTKEQRERASLISCGPRSQLTSFTSAQRWGLQGWERDEIHVVGPAGTARPRIRGLMLHRITDWQGAEIVESRRLHRIAPSLILAAGSMPTRRGACAILASGVQQRLVTADALQAALDRQPKIRNFRPMRLALYDIAGGSHALSEIDFYRLCRRNRLQAPRRQGVRTDPNGLRRYLDVEWELPDGRILVVEVDGAIHVEPLEWYNDQLRQNEVVIGGSPVLRYPSVIVRSEEAIVVDQLRRALV